MIASQRTWRISRLNVRMTSAFDYGSSHRLAYNRLTRPTLVRGRNIPVSARKISMTYVLFMSYFFAAKKYAGVQSHVGDPHLGHTTRRPLRRCADDFSMKNCHKIR